MPYHLRGFTPRICMCVCAFAEALLMQSAAVLLHALDIQDSDCLRDAPACCLVCRLAELCRFPIRQKPLVFQFPAVLKHILFVCSWPRSLQGGPGGVSDRAFSSENLWFWAGSGPDPGG